MANAQESLPKRFGGRPPSPAFEHTCLRRSIKISPMYLIWTHFFIARNKVDLPELGGSSVSRRTLRHCFFPERLLWTTSRLGRDY